MQRRAALYMSFGISGSVARATCITLAAHHGYPWHEPCVHRFPSATTHGSRGTLASTPTCSSSSNEERSQVYFTSDGVRKPCFSDSFQIIVQAVSNVAYVHALFSFISEMSENEQRIWSSTGTSKDKEVCRTVLVAVQSTILSIAYLPIPSYSISETIPSAILQHQWTSILTLLPSV